MLKSLCIKTKNERINSYLLERFQNLDLADMYISDSKFKIYRNMILHYAGSNTDIFLREVSFVLSDSIIQFYEHKLLKDIILSNYFYFTDIEQRKILDICLEHLDSHDFEHSESRKNVISLCSKEYFAENKSLILDGFVSFRLKDYIKILDSVVDLCVNKFVIDREYTEFIDLLKVYIVSKECGCEVVHLVYKNQESVLLDQSKNIIELDNDILSNKYLSDISFSSNDFALNSLLTLLPKAIYIHVVDAEDEFINTLKLIFDNRVSICTDCNICKMYRLEKIKR